MHKIIKENYDSIVKRGLITKKTKHIDFIDKIYEEVNELEEFTNYDNLKEEMADVILTVLNYAKHYKVDIEKELIKKIELNKNR